MRWDWGLLKSQRILTGPHFTSYHFPCAVIGGAEPGDSFTSTVL